MVNMKILDLPLKAKWYEMIESGNKKEEYREIKKYWIGRLAKCGGRNSYEKTGFYCLSSTYKCNFLGADNKQ